MLERMDCNNTPNREKTTENPKTNKKVLAKIFILAFAGLVFASSTEEDARNVRKAGINGRTQGERKETNPAINAKGIVNSTI